LVLFKSFSIIKVSFLDIFVLLIPNDELIVLIYIVEQLHLINSHIDLFGCEDVYFSLDDDEELMAIISIVDYIFSVFELSVLKLSTTMKDYIILNIVVFLQRLKESQSLKIDNQFLNLISAPQIVLPGENVYDLL
jgi:hypothetical protein